MSTQLLYVKQRSQLRSSMEYWDSLGRNVGLVVSCPRRTIVPTMFLGMEPLEGQGRRFRDGGPSVPCVTWGPFCLIPRGMEQDGGESQLQPCPCSPCHLFSSQGKGHQPSSLQEPNIRAAFLNLTMSLGERDSLKSCPGVNYVHILLFKEKKNQRNISFRH